MKILKYAIDSNIPLTLARIKNMCQERVSVNY